MASSRAQVPSWARDHQGTLTEPGLSCARPMGSSIGWAGLTPRLIVSEVGSEAPASQPRATLIPDRAAENEVVTWHTRGLLLQSQKTYRIDYEVQYFDSIDSNLRTPRETTLADAPIYVRLADEVVVVPVFPIVWVRDVPSTPEHPLDRDVQTWVPRLHATEVLFDYTPPFYEPFINEAGREVLRMGGESRHEYTPDAIGHQCYTRYGLCSVQFQQFLGHSSFAVSGTRGGNLCETTGTNAVFGIRPTDATGEVWRLEAGDFYHRQMWEIVPPDQAMRGREIYMLSYNYGELKDRALECGFNGIRHNGLPMVSVEAREHYGPIAAHEFGHVLLYEGHCGHPGYGDRDSHLLSDSECHAQQLLMTELAPRDDTLLTESQCEVLCSETSFASGMAKRFVEYAKHKHEIDQRQRCCITPEGQQEVLTRESCLQIGGSLSDITTRSSEGVTVPFPEPTGLGWGGGLCERGLVSTSTEPAIQEGIIEDYDPMDPTECCRAADGSYVIVAIGTCGGETASFTFCGREVR